MKNFFSELGYRYTIEDRYQPEDNQYSNKARAYTEWNHKYSETFRYRLWAEYVPNFSQSKDYLMVYEASLTSILTSMFSLKVAYKGMYDNVPAVMGNKNYDYTYTTSLVAKF
jgi:putative salt-induced outer membrane protein